MDKSAYFDSRAFNIPKEEVVNYFLFRQKDWERNSLSMYARTFFPIKNYLTNQNKNNTKCYFLLEKTGQMI